MTFKKNPKIINFKIKDLMEFKIPTNIRSKLEKLGLEWTTINGVIDSANYELYSAKLELKEVLIKFEKIFKELRL